MSATYSRPAKKVCAFWSLGISPQSGDTTSSITCRIFLDGTEISTQTSTGAYSVSCAMPADKDPMHAKKAVSKG